MLDLILRGMALGAGFLIAALLMARRPRPRGAVSVVAVAICLGAYILISAPTLNARGPLRAALVTLATAAPLALMWMVLSLLAPRGTDRLGWLALGAVAVLGGLGAGIWPQLEPVRAAVVIVLYLGMIWLALRAQPDDLVPGRRRFRQVFIGAMGVLGLIISLVEAFNVQPGANVMVLQAAALMMATFAFGLYALSPASDLWASRRTPDKPSPALAPLAAQLEQAMAEGIWRQEGLRIGALARHLNVPEHRLRALINTTLGFRNFSTFINAARIEAACRALRDAEQRQRTVLEIAYDVGFSSLGPFNRAFRDVTGTSPTAYRAESENPR